MLHADEVTSFLGMEAISDWQLHPELLGEMPPALLEEVGLALANRRSPALVPAIRVATQMYLHRSQSLTTQFDELVATGLSALLDETESGSEVEDLVYDGDDARSAAADFVGAMRKAGRIIRSLEDRWAAAAAADPLPDVRNALDRVEGGDASF